MHRRHTHHRNAECGIVDVGEELADRLDVTQVAVLAARDDDLDRAAFPQFVHDKGAEETAAACPEPVACTEPAEVKGR